MALRPAPLLLLVLGAVGSRESRFGSRLHSLKYFYTSISDPYQGLPHFVVLGYVDNQVFVHYDSNSRKFQRRVSWMKKVDKNDPEYWDKYTEILQDNEKLFRKDLESLRTRYNHSKGCHTWQRMISCELQGNRSKGGLWQYGYQGKTFITFDKKTLTWVALEHPAEVTQRKWNVDSELNQHIKSYLDEECIAWLEKYLSYGNETLLRTEPPVVTMSSRRETKDGMETHVCRLDGFYPREIDASWKRDGEVWLQDTFHGSVAPYADGTYHYWLNIQIDSKERDRYRCHVEHDGLQDPLDLELKEPTDSKSSLALIIGCVVLILVPVGAGILAFIFRRRWEGYRAALRRRWEGYRAASRSVQGSSSSVQGSVQGSNSSDQGSNQAMLCSLHSPSGQSQHEERGETMESTI